MQRLILQHRYSQGLAWDLSGFNNHGTPRGVRRGTGAQTGSLHFARPNSRIDVPQSPSLLELSALRCSVTFRLEGPRTERYNLVESQGSFAFFIEKNHRLAITVMDATGEWTGAFSARLPQLANPGWHRADCGHDGVDTAWLAFDGHIIATATGVPGPLRGAGPNGLTIGHWPERIDAFAFSGHISEVWLWTTRPDPPVEDCCVDTQSLARAEQTLRDDGHDIRDIRERIAIVGAVSAELRRLVPESHGAEFDRDVAALNRAVRGQDWVQVERLSRQIRTQIDPHLSEDRGRELARTVAPLFRDFLQKPELLADVAAAFLCNFTGTVPPVDDDDLKQQPWRPWGTTEPPTATLPTPAAPASDDSDPTGIPPDLPYEPGPRPKRTRRRKDGNAEP